MKVQTMIRKNDVQNIVIPSLSQPKYAMTTVKPEKNTTIKFHENALKQFSR